MTLMDFLAFSGATAVVGLIANLLLRRFWVALLVSVSVASLLNVAYEAFRHEFAIRPADAFFWIPMQFVAGVIAALPAAILVGLGFYLIRRRRRTNAA